jgi:hypothetical protein
MVGVRMPVSIAKAKPVRLHPGPRFPSLRL